MSDYGDYADDYEDGGDWLYVEDHYDEADELAEHQVPSPTLAAQETIEDYDPYDYFEDLAYLSDAVYDQNPPRKSGKKGKGPGGKTTSNRSKAGKPETTASHVTYQTPVILWRTSQERREEREQGPATEEASTKPVSLLSDWRDRFRNERGFSMKQRSLEDVQDNADEERPTGEGFDLNDLQSVAKMFSQENLSQLQEMLEAQGLDSSAIQAVLEDLLAGREPDLEGQEEEVDGLAAEVAEANPDGNESRGLDAGTRQRGLSPSLGDMAHRTLKRRQSSDAHDNDIELRGSSSKRMRRHETATNDSANRKGSRSEGCAPGLATSMTTPPKHHKPLNRVTPAKRHASSGTTEPDEAPTRKRRGRIRHDDDQEGATGAGSAKEETGEKFKTSELDGNLQESGKAAGTPRLVSPRASRAKHTKGSDGSTDETLTRRQSTRRSTRRRNG